MPSVHCAHTCKTFCTGLESAIAREKEAILHYAVLRDECTYPDVKMILNQMILERKGTIAALEQLKLSMAERFEVLDQVRESFDIE